MEDYDFFMYFPRAWSFLPIHWIDNVSFVMGDILFHPFEYRVETAFFNTAWSSLNVRAYSPDNSLAFSGFAIDSIYKYGLYEPDDPENTFIELTSFDGLSWKRDSSEFIAVVENEDFEPTHLALYNRDGEWLRDIMNVEDKRVEFVDTLAVRRNETQWSPDDQKFIFSWHGKSYSDPRRIYIIDFESEQVIDTCLDTVNVPVWSSDGKMLAYLESSRDNQNIVIIDLGSSKAYIVGKHIGTRSEMVGWRE